MRDREKKAVVLLSCGLDSPTALALMQEQGFRCYALTIDYGQRNSFEIKRASQLAAALAVEEHRVIKLDIGSWGGSAITDHRLPVPNTQQSKVPITYVPSRNFIFLAVALGWAEVLGAGDLVIGCNAVDQDNYPDCRKAFLDSFVVTANLATRSGQQQAVVVHAPLLRLNKAAIINEAQRLQLDLSLTQSCYNPATNGSSCGQCNACQFRAEGFEAAQQQDPGE